MPWTTEDWGLAQHYTIDIEDAFFAPDARFGDQILMQWKGKGHNLDADEPFEAHEMIPVGGDWQSFDGGKTVAHNKGRESFHTRSTYGRIIDSMLALGLGPIMADRGDPREAKVWVGLRFRMERRTETIKVKGKEQESTRSWPVEFLGTIDGTVNVAPSPEATPVADIEGELRKLAASHATHSTFISAALQIPGASADQWLTKITDEGFFNSLKG